MKCNNTQMIGIPEGEEKEQGIETLLVKLMTEFYPAERKKELIPFAMAWMELESIMLSEISQVVRDKYHMISPLTGTNQQKKKANKI